MAYVIGPDTGERELVAQTIHEITGMTVAAGLPSKQTLSALGSRNVKLLAVAGECLQALSFRNEFELRCRGSKLSAVPIFLYGPDRYVRPALGRMPSATALAIRQPGDLGSGLRRQLETTSSVSTVPMAKAPERIQQGA